jgi:pimeloyl-ACP methyl ester carboxylesterase
MLGSLVQTTTRDGIQLHGFLASPSSARRIWILVHGVNSNFYSSSLLRELAAGLETDGSAILLVNTRGHDLLSFNTGGVPTRLGSQVEHVSSCVYDLDAWSQFALDQGFERCSLLGHSLGALKCCLWAARNPHRLEHVIAVSPPRLNTQILSDDPDRGEVFQKHLQDAKNYCESGKPEHVMKVRYPLPMWICATTYLEKYGSGSRYDYVELASQITIRCLWTFGEVEINTGSANFRNADRVLAEAIEGFPAVQNSHQVRVIANADHGYRGVRGQLLQAIERWLVSQGNLLD